MGIKDFLSCKKELVGLERFFEFSVYGKLGKESDGSISTLSLYNYIKRQVDQM
jgi:hypothetical protein